MYFIQLQLPVLAVPGLMFAHFYFVSSYLYQMANHINALDLELDTCQVCKSYKLPLGECIAKVPTTLSALSILQLNIRSLNNFFVNFMAFIHFLKIYCDIIILTECWLRSAVIPTVNGYNIHFTKKKHKQSE